MSPSMSDASPAPDQGPEPNQDPVAEPSPSDPPGSTKLWMAVVTLSAASYLANSLAVRAFVYRLTTIARHWLGSG